MNTILENPIGIGLFGAVITGLLVLIAKQLGDRRAIYAAIATAVATLILCIISVSLVSEREKLTRTIYEVADAVRANDHNRALSYMHPNATPATQRAKSEISRFKFDEAKVTSIKSVLINDATKPPTATTEFIATMKVTGDQSYYGMKGGGARLLIVTWVKQGDRWLIHDYEHRDVREGLMK